MSRREDDDGALTPRGSPQRDVLLALAARCESEGPSFVLEQEIAVAIGFGVEGGRMFTLDSVGDLASYIKLPAYTTSLDAAVTLVPEGWRIHCITELYGQFSACLHRTFGNPEADEDVWRIGHSWPSKHMASAKAKTAAAALDAAALRARAAIASKDSGVSETRPKGTSNPSEPHP